MTLPVLRCNDTFGATVLFNNDSIGFKPLRKKKQISKITKKDQNKLADAGAYETFLKVTLDPELEKVLNMPRVLKIFRPKN